MNILSFDIEEWYIEKKFCGGRVEKYRKFDSYWLPFQRTFMVNPNDSKTIARRYERSY